MKPNSGSSGYRNQVLYCMGMALACWLMLANGAAAQSKPEKTAASAPKSQTFATAQEAADALIEASRNTDEARLTEIFGPNGHEIISTGEPALDKELWQGFAAKAAEKNTVSIDPKSSHRAFLLVGKDEWPFPAPIVKKNNRWSFDVAAGRQEIVYRRIGRNELDAIEICHGYVEAQHEYALEKREGYDVNQYAQRIISTPGKQDGLAWRNPDGTLGGPIGENVARAIEQGYTDRAKPYHGYFFKILKGQGPAAPLGRMDFVIKGVMIGGFALVASPAEYGVTGVKSFIVSHDGVVYEKDLGPDSLKIFTQMEIFNPDKTWSPVREEE